jgi:hypothetical protein
MYFRISTYVQYCCVGIYVVIAEGYTGDWAWEYPQRIRDHPRREQDVSIKEFSEMNWSLTVQFLTTDEIRNRFIDRSAPFNRKDVHNGHALCTCRMDMHHGNAK